MTAHEALWTLKVQLQKTPQNMEAIQVLEGLVKSIHRVHIDDDYKTYTLDEAIIELGLGNELEHIKNHMAKVGKGDIEEYSKSLTDFAEFVGEDDE